MHNSRGQVKTKLSTNATIGAPIVALVDNLVFT